MDSRNHDKFNGPIGISALDGCTQCKECCFQFPDPEKPNDFDYSKAICLIYTAERGMKPSTVMDDQEPCQYFYSLDKIIKDNP